jgi:hypothetical protein
VNLLVFGALMTGRADMIRARRKPPYVVNLPPRRASRLRAELRSMGISFGIPLDGRVPLPPEDEDEWIYMGIVLGDLHVFGRVDAPRTASR